MQLKIGENIYALRRERKIRQEELADFLGVTKASVSKWETKQSYPDILLLPQIAAFFNISIDELLGYEPQLSKEQIIKVYQDLAQQFADSPFEEVMTKTKDLVKEFYSCYPFLIQIALLWFNHFTLSTDTSRRTEILNDIAHLCDHIIDESSDVNLQQDAMVIKALVNVNLGKMNEVIEVMKPFVDSKNYQLQPDSILIQAYQLSGNQEQADYYNQVILYMNLMNLVQNSIISLGLHMGDLQQCMTTIKRTSSVVESYELEKLNPNLVLQFYYQCALVYSSHAMKEEAITNLSQFVKESLHFLRNGMQLHGDEYFTRLKDWIEDSPFGTIPPRNEKIVYESLSQALNHPLFEGFTKDREFQYLRKILTRKEEF